MNEMKKKRKAGNMKRNERDEKKKRQPQETENVVNKMEAQAC